MFQWLKRKPTLDETIATTFLEQGRWVECSTNVWLDTKTEAKLFVVPRGGLRINDVPVGVKTHQAFWDMAMKPHFEAIKEKQILLDKLYA